MSGRQQRLWTLGKYLAFASSGLSVLLTVLLALVIGRTASDSVTASIGANLAELAGQTTSRLDRSVYERHREIQLMSTRLAGLKDWNAVRVELDAARDSYRFYAWLGVVDEAGVVRAASGGLLQGADVSQRPWFRNALSGIHLGDVHEAVLLAKLLPASDGEPQRFFDVAFPLRGGGGPTGVLAAHVSWDWARDVRQAIFGAGRRGEVDPLIVNEQGVVLLGPRDVEGRTLELASLAQAAKGARGFVEESWPDGERYLVGYAASKGYLSSPGLGWRVLVRQDLDAAFEPVRQIQRRVLAWGASLALLFSLLGWWAARAVTRPLLELAAAARRLEQGRGGEIQASHAYREVQVLGSALNAMLAAVRQKSEELRQLNVQLEVERMKDEFISTVSHELRTPLTATYGSLKLLSSGMAGELPPDAKQLLQISHDSTERLIRLVNDMLDLETIASGKLEYRLQPQPLRPLVEQAIRDTQAYADRFGVRLVLAPGASPLVHADADRIIQVCVNLLSNAAKFSPAGDHVEITVQAQEGQARVAVADHGAGLPPEFRDRVFERFAQADASDRRPKGGTGLGLAICRSIVLAHGGTIGFTSEPDVRTEFFFELPLAQAPG